MTPDEEPTMMVRKAAATDAALLAELGARTFRDTYAELTRREDLEEYIAARYRPDLQAAELRDPSHCYLLAEVGGVPAGFALLRDDRREPGVPGDRPVMLAQIYVDRPFLGTGVGAALMRSCLEEARRGGHDVVGVGVWDRNARAIAFYERWGFSEVSEMTFVMGAERQRDLVLALRL